ncbi:hypothetical protein [Bacillus infantis]|nr:hypothetical protein [Bacillus infantis]MCP1158186.1 hypothetical protein [Bacillus infantis]
MNLIIQDKTGVLPFRKERAELLFQLIFECYEQKSLNLTFKFQI